MVRKHLIRNNFYFYTIAFFPTKGILYNIEVANNESQLQKEFQQYWDTSFIQMILPLLQQNQNLTKQQWNKIINGIDLKFTFKSVGGFPWNQPQNCKETLFILSPTNN